MLKYYEKLTEKQRQATTFRAVAANISFEGHVDIAKELFKKADKISKRPSKPKTKVTS